MDPDSILVGPVTRIPEILLDRVVEVERALVALAEVRFPRRLSRDPFCS